MAKKLKGKKSMYRNSKLRLVSILMLIATMGLMTQVQASDKANKDTSAVPPPPGPYRIVPTDTQSPAIVNRAMPPQQQLMQHRNMSPQDYDQRRYYQQRYEQQRPHIAPMYQQNSNPRVMPQQNYWNAPPARSYAMPPRAPQQQAQPPQYRDWNASPKMQAQPPVTSKQQLQPQTQQQAKQPLTQQQGNRNTYPPRYAQPPAASEQDMQSQNNQQRYPAYPFQPQPAWAVRPAPVQPQWGQPQYAPPRRTIPQQQYTPGYRSAPPRGYVPQNTMPPAANWQRPTWGYAPRY